MSVLKYGEDPLDHGRVRGRILQDLGTILWCVSVNVNNVRDIRTHQGYGSEGIEAIEYEVSVGFLQIVAGRAERGLERPFLLANPYQGCTSRSSSNRW